MDELPLVACGAAIGVPILPVGCMRPGMPNPNPNCQKREK